MAQPSNPPVIPADTSPDVWRRQMAARASMSVADRLRDWAETQESMATVAAAGVRRRHPDYTDRDVRMSLVRARYGDDAALALWPDETLRDR